MNERIRELAKQADKWFEEDGHSYSRPEWNRKFAELIVKECVNLFVSDHDEEHDEILESIKEHFGIEE